MDARATKLQAAENDLKQLMADVSRAMEKAQEAVASITSNADKLFGLGVDATKRTLASIP